MIIDSHAHLNFSAFDKDRDGIIKKCLDNDIWVVNIGTNLITSKQVVELAKKYDEGIYASVGLHPMALDTGLVKVKSDEFGKDYFEKEFDFEEYKKLAQSEKVVAIGEIGLDYYWRPKTKTKKELFRQKQEDLLLKQLELAKELSLPVVFHCRMANHDLFRILEENPGSRPGKAVAHSFVGSVDDMKKHVEMGYFIGYNGIIFKDIEGIDFREVIRQTPVENIVVETDCPYLVPKGIDAERNEPLFVEHVAREIAGIKGMSFEEIAEITTKNARELFSI